MNKQFKKQIKKQIIFDTIATLSSTLGVLTTAGEQDKVKIVSQKILKLTKKL
jgi:hypothetical protein